ncbi:GspH/FimT family pseudopilin [Dyella sp. C11]|uniref:GspH/FimT family pseudopilin n=1 Tax=Dyella sp. C11 TaxID=2126991 RepID=UPI000D646689|nr:GspH/FimT family pseudopilin [Dyella sp. C11]
MKLLLGSQGANPARRGKGDPIRGFSLIELIVTLVIASIILAFAIPSFRAMIIANRLTTATNDIVDALNTARVEAVKRNGNVQFCASTTSDNTTDTLGTACSTNSGAVYGLSVNSTGNTAADQVRGTPPALVSPLKISSTVTFTAIRFNGQGMGMKAGTTVPFSDNVVQICATNISRDNIRTVALAAGSIVQVTTSSGTCS